MIMALFSFYALTLRYVQNVWLLKEWGKQGLQGVSQRVNLKDAEALGVGIGPELKEKRAEIASEVCKHVNAGLTCFFFECVCVIQAGATYTCDHAT